MMRFGQALIVMLLSFLSKNALAIPGGVAAPLFNPVAGTYNNTQSVTITCATPGAAICYRTDGVDPTAATAGTCDAGSTTYSAPVAVTTNSTTIRAIGTRSGGTNSVVATAAYTLTTGTPTFSPVGGSYVTTQNVTLSTVTTGATLCYRTDGVNPTAPTPGTCGAGSITYSGAITVSSTKTILALGTKANFNNSSVSSATYTIGAFTRKRVQVVQ
jgi:hypothetical protein